MILSKILSALAVFMCLSGSPVYSANSSACAAPWRHYVETESGFSFNYPPEAKLTDNPDRDTLAKMNGQAGGTPYEISLKRWNGPSGADPYLAMKALIQNAFPKLPGGVLVRQESTSVGTGGRIPAQTATIRMRDAASQLQQKWVIFADAQDRQRLKVLVFTAPEAGFTSLEPLFNLILASVGHDSNSSSPARPAADNTRAKDADKSFCHDGLCFKYPSNWSLQESPDADTIAKFKSPANISAAEIALASFPVASYSNVQIGKLIEDQLWSSLKDVKTRRDVMQQWGTHNDVHGVRKMASFEMDRLGHGCSQLFILQHGGHAYCLSYTTVGIRDDEAVRQFDRVLATLSLR